MSRESYPQYKVDKLALVRQFIKHSNSNFLIIKLKNNSFNELIELREKLGDNYKLYVAKINILKMAMQLEKLELDKVVERWSGTTAMLYCVNDIHDKSLCLYYGIQKLLKDSKFTAPIFGVLAGKTLSTAFLKKLNKYENLTSIHSDLLVSMKTLHYKDLMMLETLKYQLVYLLSKRIENLAV
jgi:ribosomal protein L10